MKKMWKILAVSGVFLMLQGCQRIETGEVGLRVGFDKQVNTTELQPGTFNQTVIGDVLNFQVRDIGVELNNMHPQTSDNSTLSDFDLQIIYSITPSRVGEIYTSQSKAFHARDDAGDNFLMYHYMTTIARNAAYKAVAKYPAMETVRKRDAIEQETEQIIKETLIAEGHADALTVTQVKVRSVLPAQVIIDSANLAIAKQNELIAKQKEVEIAKAEGERQAFLSRPANLEYMKVQAALNISEGVRDGKVNTIVIPSTLTMLGGVGK